MYPAIKTTLKRDINGNRYICASFDALYGTVRFREKEIKNITIDTAHLKAARGLLEKLRLNQIGYRMIQGTIDDDNQVFTLIARPYHIDFVGDATCSNP